MVIIYFPFPFEDFIKVFSIALSVDSRVAGMNERATLKLPASMSCIDPGWVSSRFVRKTSNHARYLKLFD